MNPSRNGNRKLNITRNLKAIESLKTELVDGVASLFKAMIPNQEKAIKNALLRLIIGAYTLGKRLGISYEELDQELDQELQGLIEDQHEIEDWFGDLGQLKKHLQKRRTNI